MSDLVNYRRNVCAVCGKFISNGMLSVMELSKRKGVVAQILQPVQYNNMTCGTPGASIMSAQTISSIENDIACSEDCAVQLMDRLANKHIGEDACYVALSGQEIRKLGESIDAKAYVLEALPKVHRELAAWEGQINNPNMRLGTTFDRVDFNNVLEAPKSTFKSLQVGDYEIIDADFDVVDEKPKHPRSWLKRGR